MATKTKPLAFKETMLGRRAPTRVVNMRLDDAVISRVKDRAVKNGRTFSAEVRAALERHLASA